MVFLLLAINRNVARTEVLGGPRKFWGEQSNVFWQEMHEIRDLKKYAAKIGYDNKI